MTTGPAPTPSTDPRPAPVRVAVVGKGGVGKSVMSGTLSRLLAQAGHRVLAIDSDPMPGLAFSLGLDIGDDALLDGFAVQGDDRSWALRDGLDAAAVVEQTAVEGPDGVRFLQFGKTRSASMAAFRTSIQALFAITHDLEDDSWSTVHDLSAGTRQLYAGWTGRVPGLLLVVEPSAKSVLTVRRLARVRESNPAIRLGLVINKVDDPSDVQRVSSLLPGIEVLAQVPRDPAVAAADAAGRALVDMAPAAPAVAAIRALVQALPSWLAETEEAA